VSAALCWVHCGFNERVLLMLVRFGIFNELWHFVRSGCEFVVFHICAVEVSLVVGYCAALLGDRCLMFQDRVLISSSRVDCPEVLVTWPLKVKYHAVMKWWAPITWWHGIVSPEEWRHRDKDLSQMRVFNG
jgi:hypothetical protein